MKIDYKSALVGAVFTAAIVFGIGAASNEPVKRFELAGVASNCAYWTDTSSGRVLFWNGLAWKEVTPPK